MILGNIGNDNDYVPENELAGKWMEERLLFGKKAAIDWFRESSFRSQADSEKELSTPCPHRLPGTIIEVAERVARELRSS